MVLKVFSPLIKSELILFVVQIKMLNRFGKKLFSNGRLLKRFSGQNKRGDLRPKLDFNIGEDYGNFKLLSKDYFPEYQFTLFKFKHNGLGTTHYHIDTNDTNNCFTVTFKTLPDDNSGKMHILEHLALCGSEKYPVRDPFFNMIKRSLNTFMNAWTGPDFTSYPFSTANEKDFYNLLSVYGDSVFKPLLRKTDFMQEGWRLELENSEDLKSPIKIKGVVFNEMKGAYENPDTLFMENIQTLILGGTPYQYDSGGKPFEIPSLTHEKLKEFHKRNYHPSNATIFTYGDLSPLEHQKFLDEQYLKDFTRHIFEFPNLFPKLSGPIRKTLKMPPPTVEIKKDHDSMFAVTFLCNKMGENIEDIIGLNVLSNLLFDNPKSPFYADFLESGLADSYCPGIGYEMTLMPSFFTIGFKNIKRGSEEDLEKRIFETLERVVKEGLDQGMIDSAIHQIELRSKVSKDNFGLQIFMGYMGAINHNVDSVIKQGLNIKQVLQYISDNASNGYFEGLIKKYFLDNQNRLYLTMESDVTYNEFLMKEEKELVEKIDKELGLKEREQINKEAAQLKKEQETLQDVSSLPTLTVNDIPLAGETTHVQKEEIQQIPVYFFDKPVNGVTHLRMKIDLSNLDHSNIHNLTLLSLLLDKIGTAKNSYDEFHELMHLYTSGITLNLHYDGHPHDNHKINGFAVLSISCLDKNIKKMFELLSELLTTPDFKDFENILNQIRMEASNASNLILEKPLEFAIDYGISSNRQAQQYFNKLESVDFNHAESIYLQLRLEPPAAWIAQ